MARAIYKNAVRPLGDTEYMLEQWGIFALCVLYTVSWLRGLKQHWIKSYAKP